MLYFLCDIEDIAGAIPESPTGQTRMSSTIYVISQKSREQPFIVTYLPLYALKKLPLKSRGKYSVQCRDLF